MKDTGNPRLADKVVIVAGAGRGVGRSQALACVKAGARVVLVDSGVEVDGSGGDATVVESVAKEAVASGGSAIALSEDVTAPGASGRIAGAAEAAFGRIDGLVYSAGILRERTVLHTTTADLQAVWEVHVRAAFSLTSAVAGRLVAQKRGGSIVLNAGPAAFFGAARQSLGAVGAAAAVALVRSAAVELRKHAIRVNALAPTARTRQTASLPVFASIRDGSMTPDDVAPATLFLLSDAGAEVSGEVVGVAGKRVYALRGRETSGVYFDVGGSADDLEKRWREITRA